MNGIKKISIAKLNEVGIVVPTLGTRISFLVESLESVKKAGCTNVILVGPKDKLLKFDLIDGLYNQIIDDPMKGLPEAINIGFKSFPGYIKYIGWLADDDHISEESLITSIEILEDRPEVVATFGSCKYISETGEKIFTNFSGNWASKFMNFLPNLIPQPGSLFRRSAVEKVGGVKATYPLSFDFELFFELRKYGKIHFIPNVQGEFRWHENSLSVNQRRAAIKQTSQIRKANLPKHLKIFSWIWEPLIIFATLTSGTIIRKLRGTTK